MQSSMPSSTMLFVRNLPFEVTKEMLEEYFSEIGPVRKVNCIKEKGRSKEETVTKGFAFVKFAMEEDAQLAIERLNGKEFQGRSLYIELAKAKSGQPKPRAMPKETIENEHIDAQQEAPIVGSETQPNVEKEEVSEIVPKASRDAQVEKMENTKTNVPIKKSKEKRVQDSNERGNLLSEQTAKKNESKENMKENMEEADAMKIHPKKSKEKRVSAKKEEVKVQSERNARRKKHRELLRQVRDQKEAKASTDEKTVILSGLSKDITQKQLYKRVKKAGDVQSIVLKEDAARPSHMLCVIEFKTLTDVNKAIPKLDKHIIKGATVSARRLVSAEDSAQRQSEQKQESRIIMRNLSFQATEDDLRPHFQNLGPISDLKVVRMPSDDPKDPKGVGRSRGFAFAQFLNRSDAQAAVEKLNGMKVQGRNVVVDLALSKAAYEQARKDINQQQGGQQENEEEEPDEEGDFDVGATTEEGDTDEPGPGSSESMDEKTHGEEGSAEESEEKDDDDDDDFVTTKAHGDEEEEEGAEGEQEGEEGEAEKESAPFKMVDTEEERYRTLFLRNVSFESTKESIFNRFKEFGFIDYVKVVYDRDSGLSKGVAFLRFQDVASTDKALEAANASSQQRCTNLSLNKRDGKFKNQTTSSSSSSSSGLLWSNAAWTDGDGIQLDGRTLIVARAVDRSDASQLAEENAKKGQRQDRRNLYLQHEGYINVNQVEGEEMTMPPLDAEKRKRAIKERKEKLKNPMYFISPLRLCVRSLATSVDDKALKRLCLEAAQKGVSEKVVDMSELKKDFQPIDKNVPIKVIMAKVVRDEENIKPGQDLPKSRGFGFVEFQEHFHAIAALRMLNNNPAYTQYTAGGQNKKGGKVNAKPRLLVEFALENHAKLKLREKKQLEMNKKRYEQKALAEAESGTKELLTIKTSRGKKQRMKKRKQDGMDGGEGGEGGGGEVEAVKVFMEQNKKQKKSDVDGLAGESKVHHHHLAKKRLEGETKKELTVQKVATSTEDLSRRQRKRKQMDEQKEDKMFDNLVSTYKKQLLTSSNASNDKKDRWFD